MQGCHDAASPLTSSGSGMCLYPTREVYHKTDQSKGFVLCFIILSKSLTERQFNKTYDYVKSEF